MQAKQVFAIATVIFSQGAFALNQCPAEAGKKTCGPNPLYPIIWALTKSCSKLEPEDRDRYMANLDRLVEEDRDAYAKLEMDSEFKKKTKEFEKYLSEMPPKDLHSECKKLLNE